MVLFWALGSSTSELSWARLSSAEKLKGPAVVPSWALRG